MKLPVLSGIELVKILAKLGFEIDHQTGSHLILRQGKHPFARVTVPSHKVISIGTLKSILRQVNLSNEEFIKLIKK